jgi:hypothetical protein
MSTSRSGLRYIGLTCLGLLAFEALISSARSQAESLPVLSIVRISENGGLDQVDLVDVLKRVVDEGPTDVFVFSHGWLNVEIEARSSYEKMIAKMAALADQRALRPQGFKPLPLGVHWPSMDMDKQFEDFDTLVKPKLVGPASGLGSPEASRLINVALSGLSQINMTWTRTDLGRRFVEPYLQVLAASKSADPHGSKMAAYQLLSEQSPPLARTRSPKDVEQFVDLSEGRIADTAEMTQAYTFWKMRRRAGIVGANGLRPLLAAIQNAPVKEMAIHLIGHSFGCKVVMAALTGGEDRLPRPIQSVVLIQGAISDQSFDEKILGLDCEGAYRIALSTAIINGPIVATSSQHDRALSYWFPKASLVGRQLGELNEPVKTSVLARIQLEHPVKFDGLLQALGGKSKGEPMKDVGQNYTFGTDNKVVRINASNFIVGGAGPGGAHSEIFNEPVAWLIWSAALDGRGRPR